MAARDIKTFGDAARLASEEETEHEEPILVKILDREIEIEFPGTGQVIFMTAEFNEAQSDISQIGGLMQMLYHLVSPEDARFLRQSLLSRDSGFNGDDVLDLIEYLTEQWSSRPTMNASGSSPSQAKSGRPSTGGARRRASNPSGSRSGGS